MPILVKHPQPFNTTKRCHQVVQITQSRASLGSIINLNVSRADDSSETSLHAMQPKIQGVHLGLNTLQSHSMPNLVKHTQPPMTPLSDANETQQLVQPQKQLQAQLHSCIHQSLQQFSHFADSTARPAGTERFPSAMNQERPVPV